MPLPSTAQSCFGSGARANIACVSAMVVRVSAVPEAISSGAVDTRDAVDGTELRRPHAEERRQDGLEQPRGWPRCEGADNRAEHDRGCDWRSRCRCRDRRFRAPAHRPRAALARAAPPRRRAMSRWRRSARPAGAAARTQQRRGIEAFQPTEGDARARALAMRLEIEQQHRKAFGVQKPRPPQHGEPVALDAVHQHDRAAARRPCMNHPATSRRSPRRSSPSRQEDRPAAHRRSRAQAPTDRSQRR